MKKTKKQPVQLDLWGNPIKKRKTKLSKFVAFNTERELFIRLLNDAKAKESK